MVWAARKPEEPARCLRTRGGEGRGEFRSALSPVRFLPLPRRVNSRHSVSSTYAVEAGRTELALHHREAEGGMRSEDGRARARASWAHAAEMVALVDESCEGKHVDGPGAR
ncbi:uncharacterized protein FIBRA_08481 [Fibroporia radiculosa]|uniref:Uncharacterized protein n=1 Tax=Fibroporia radiculosa TaxID=599839 RepID=J4GWV9_9APHY|nr:uncharacterized protein FIBRA_08481 [Fibroporia radiculosa]CCM06235.1 predicted protein [Fibroporia radiculosa]